MPVSRRAAPKTRIEQANEGKVFVYPEDVRDTADIATRLLDAADNPIEVRTVTGPPGWLVDGDIADKAGFTTSKKTTRRKSGGQSAKEE